MSPFRLTFHSLKILANARLSDELEEKVHTLQRERKDRVRPKYLNHPEFLNFFMQEEDFERIESMRREERVELNNREDALRRRERDAEERIRRKEADVADKVFF